MYQSPYCCIVVRCSAVLICPLNGSTDRLVTFRRSRLIVQNTIIINNRCVHDVLSFPFSLVSLSLSLCAWACHRSDMWVSIRIMSTVCFLSRSLPPSLSVLVCVCVLILIKAQKRQSRWLRCVRYIENAITCTEKCVRR